MLSKKCVYLCALLHDEKDKNKQRGLTVDRHVDEACVHRLTQCTSS